MSLLDDASIVLSPAGYKEGIVFSEILADGSCDFTSSCSSAPDRVGSNGYVVPTLNNLFTYSQSLDNALWIKLNVTIGADAAVAPDGTTTAESYTSSVSTSAHPVYQSKVVPTDTYTFSAYVKKVNQRYVSLKGGAGQFVHCAIIYDLDTASVVKQQGTNMPTPTGTITDVGSGWYRLTLTNTSNFNDFALQYANSATNTIGNYGDIVIAGTGTVNYYVWGMQVVRGSLPLSYEVTTDKFNTLRLNYLELNGNVRTCPNIQIEPSRTNFALGNSTIAATNATASLVSMVNPFGFLATDTYQVLFTASAGYFNLNASISFTSPTTYSCGHFIKFGNSSITLTASGANTSVINPTGTFSFDSSGVPSSTGDVYYIPYPNGWYYVFTATPALSTASSIVRWNSTGVGKYIYVYKAQYEEGVFASSYIRTTSGAVTRSAETLSKSGISSKLGQGEGTVYFEIYARKTVGLKSQNLLSIAQGSPFFTFFTAYFGNNGFLYIDFAPGGTYAFTINSGFALSNGKHRIAILYKVAGYKLFIDGVQVATSTDATAFSGTKDTILYYNSLYGYFGDFGHWTTRLSDSRAIQLTSL